MAVTGEKAAILSFKSTIISFIETGQTPTSYTSYGAIVNQVIGAAYASFGEGLHDALYLAAGLVSGRADLICFTEEGS